VGATPPRLKVKRILMVPKLIGSGFPPSPSRLRRAGTVQACPGAIGCRYEIIVTFYELGFPSAHLDRPGLGQGFNGYKRWTQLILLIKIQNTRRIPLGETVLLTGRRQNRFDMSGSGISTLNVEPPGPDLILHCSII
jgi:hypothetical protein